MGKALSALRGLRNHLAIVGGVATFLALWARYDQAYLAILLGNIVFLGLFALYDFGGLWNLSALQKRRDELMGTRLKVAVDGPAINHEKTASGSVLLQLEPQIFRPHNTFGDAFKFAYLVEDTHKFTIAYRERIRNTFFIASFVTVVTVVAFRALPAPHPQATAPGSAAAAAVVATQPSGKGAGTVQLPTPEAAAPPDLEVSEGVKIVVALAGVLLNAVNIMRLFWYYRERNSSQLRPEPVP